MLGLTVADPDTPALSQADVDGLATWVAMRMQMGPDAADGFLRVLGANVARVAEAISSMIRTSQPKMWLGLTGDELTTAQVYRDAAEFVPRLGAMIDAVHRHHLVSTRTFIEGVVSGPSASLECGVGFADLSGFTALTQTLTPAELSAMLTEFGATVSDVVHADGGRVVKFLGDAVMWVSSNPERLAKAAIDLVDHPRAREAGLQVRAGLGYGQILAINGDYFGNAVNLAARLVAAAAPGQILAADGRLRAIAAVARRRPGTIAAQGFRRSGDRLRAGPGRGLTRPLGVDIRDLHTGLQRQCRALHQHHGSEDGHPQPRLARREMCGRIPHR